jgi:hypothetical protein
MSNDHHIATGAEALASCAPAPTMLPLLWRAELAWRLLIGLFSLLVVVQLSYLCWIGNGLGPYLNPHDEADAVRAAEAYVRDGLTSHHGLPRIAFGNRFPGTGSVVFVLDQNGLIAPQYRQGFPANQAERNNWAYTHYPPGPSWMCAVLARWFGLSNLWVLRLFPCVLGLLATAVFFRELARAFGPDRAVLIVCQGFITKVIPLPCCCCN